MKRSSLLCVLLSISFSLFTNTALGAIKPETTCPSVGISAKVNGKKFSCVKVGKKLLWKKTVAIKIPKPKASSSSSNTSVLLPTPISKPGPATKEEPINIRVPAVEIDNLDAQKVYARSRQEVYDAINKSNYTNTFLNFNIGPNQDTPVVDMEKDSLNRAARVWSYIYQPSEQLEVLLYNFADLEWAKAKFKEITGTGSLYSANSCSRDYCGNASAARIDNGPWIYEQGLGGNLWNRSTAAHEYTHLAQAAGNSNFWNLAPLWIVEGMAQFYGEAIGYSPFDSNLRTRGELHRQYASDFKSANLGEMKLLLEKSDAKAIEDLMKLIEFPNPRYVSGTTAASYLIGSYGSEVLVAVYGHSSIEQFIKAFAVSSDWKSNFFKCFGITADSFYKKLTPYLFQMSKEL